MRLQVLKNTNFRKLFLANVINRFGDSVDSIAFTWLTYTMTKSASLSAIVFAANILPTVIVQPLAAPVVDKMKKKGIMVAADILRGLCLGGGSLPFVAGAGCAMDVYRLYLPHESDRSVPCAGGSIFRAEASGRKGTG